MPPYEETTYSYDAQGTRIIKDGPYGKSIYVDAGFVESSNSPGAEATLVSNHVFVGNTRVASIVKHKDEQTPATYYYASDHLGSSSVLTTSTGSYHERIEYLPYGETWIEDASNSSGYSTPYKFTGKELDKETNFYYFGARYYDARISRWVSTDPALEKYLPKPNDYDTEHDFYWYILNDASGKLPGMGGVYNVINMDVYCYGGLNPVKYVDPDGNVIAPNFISRNITWLRNIINIFVGYNTKNPNNHNDQLLASRIRQNDKRLTPDGKTACFYRALQSVAESYAGKNLTPEQINEATEKLINDGVIKSNYHVNDAKAVIIDALSRLGVDVDKLVIDYRGKVESIPEGTVATIRGVPNMTQIRDGIINAVGHFQHGDANGGLVWDPWNGTNPDNRPVNRIDAIIIKRKEE